MKPTLGVGSRRGAIVRRRGWLVALVAVIATVGAAQAATSTKLYHVTIDETTAVAGATETHTLTLANSTGSTHTLGSANVAIPTNAGFTVTAPALGTTMPVTASDNDKQWTVKHATTPSGPVLQFRAVSSQNALAPNQTVSADVEVAVSCEAETATWPTKAKQANSFSGPPGNDFLPSAAGSGPDRHERRRRPRGLHVTSTSRPARRRATRSSPDVTVTASTRATSVATGAAGNVAIAIEDDPSGGTADLDGHDRRPLADGVATFDDLTVDTSGRGLHARRLAGLAQRRERWRSTSSICCATPARPARRASPRTGTRRWRRPSPPATRPWR